MGSYHLDLHQSFVAIVKEIAGLATVDTDDAEQQLSTETEREGRVIGSNDSVDTVLKIVLQDLHLGDLPLLVGRQPCLGQRAGGTEESARPEHGGGDEDEDEDGKALAVMSNVCKRC